ncbi:H-2 class II histocompatibility antigen, I-E beta chain-like [Sinocyclocheilus rhinocerous]|uniref:H-2 class II histocompatibility antigen, I-E beta chain-like n=1 Tax=Sinocyclocheilus rhinocerous TaxID=307959 RepID=A0A673LQC1_9TELE|nr:PREDICTED: H-2 class II histocompatibility antigen, I-E beta chain-like [Sinocyclocheilus rhinocerous]
MSLLKLFSFHLIFTVSVFTLAESANEYFTTRWSRCIYSSPDLSDMVYIDSFYFNKYLFTQFNSTLGKYVGFSEYGMRNAEYWNNDTSILQGERGDVDAFCKHNAQISDSAVRSKTVKPKVKLSSVTRAGGRHPAVLMFSAYEFYPQHIKVSWLRDGKLMTSEVTSTMEMADGDWYYQIHSELEYSPKSGEKISCMVEHASFSKPMIYDWDPSPPEAERNKIAIGASGLVLGIVLAAAGLIYYKKKSAGRILVPN